MVPLTSNIALNQESSTPHMLTLRSTLKGLYLTQVSKFTKVSITTRQFIVLQYTLKVYLYFWQTCGPT